MKILLVADREERNLWDYWESAGKKRTEGVKLILSAGDIRAEYLEFLVTMLNVPCLYVRGNHDGSYDVRPPVGCIDIDGKVCEIRVPVNCSNIQRDPDGSGMRTLRIAGLGGSMRYHAGSDMYTEKEMAKRVHRLARNIRLGLVIGLDGRISVSRDMAMSAKNARQSDSPADQSVSGAVDILLTHAPCLGHGDMEDLPHRGFACFNDLLENIRPRYHCYGHVHPEYDGLRKRRSEHPSGTHLINVSGMYILEIR